MAAVETSPHASVVEPTSVPLALPDHSRANGDRRVALEPNGRARPAPGDQAPAHDHSVPGQSVSGEHSLPAAPRRTSARTSRPADRGTVRRRARRVTRIIRRIDLWSVLKLALVLYTCLYVATMVSLAVVWGVAYSTGMIERLQTFLGEVGLDNFRFYGNQMFRASAAIGAVLVLAGTLVTVLTVALVNLISELTGGIRVIVIEEDPYPSDRQELPRKDGRSPAATPSRSP